MRDIRLAGEYYADVFGGTIAAPIWKTLMDNTSEIRGGVRAFDDPGDKILEGDFVSVPNVSGLSVDEARQVLKEAGFGADVAGTPTATLSEGTVVYADPSGRALGAPAIGLYPLGCVPKAEETPKPKPKPTKTPDKPKTTTTPPKPKVTPSEAYPGQCGAPHPHRVRGPAVAVGPPGRGRPARRAARGAVPGGRPRASEPAEGDSPPRQLATVRAAGHECLAAFATSAHLRHAGGSGLGDGLRHQRLELRVVELSGEVGLEDGELGLLGLGAVGVARVAVGGGGLLALLGLLGQHLEHLVVAEPARLLAGDLLVGDGGERHPQGTGTHLVAGAHGVVQVALDGGLEAARSPAPVWQAPNRDLRGLPMTSS